MSTILRDEIADEPENWFQIPPNNDWSGYYNQEHLYYDEYVGQLKMSELNRICDGGAKMNTKGGTVELAKDVIVHIVSNYSIDECYSEQKNSNKESDYASEFITFELQIDNPEANAQAEADAKAKADAEAEAQAEADAKAKADAEAEAATKAAEEKAKAVKTVTINVSTVTATAIDKAVKAKGGSEKYVTRIVLGKRVKKISKSAFKKYKKVKTIEVKTKKLKKATVKGSLKNSKITKVLVNVGNSSLNKKYAKLYKVIFTKANVGKKVRIKKP